MRVAGQKKTGARAYWTYAAAGVLVMLIYFLNPRPSWLVALVSTAFILIYRLSSRTVASVIDERVSQ